MAGISPTTGACTTKDLAITDDGGAPATAMIYGTITVRNITGSSCQIYGFPGVDLYRADGSKEAAVGDRTGNATSIELAAGAKAYAAYLIESDTVHSCTRDAYALVTPPDQTASVRVKASYPGLGDVGETCSTSFVIHAFSTSQASDTP